MTFDPDCRDVETLRLVVRWKREQMARTGFPDIFDEGWSMPLLERLLAVRGPDCSGVLSVLYAGAEPVAGHFGLRSRKAWHWWYPAYDERLARHSPGLTMLHMMLRTAVADGHTQWLDFGTGHQPFKTIVGNDALLVTAGVAGPLCGVLAVSDLLRRLARV